MILSFGKGLFLCLWTFPDLSISQVRGDYRIEEDVSIAFPQYSNDNQLTFLSTVIVYGILEYSVYLQTKIKIRIRVTLDR